MSLLESILEEGNVYQYVPLIGVDFVEPWAIEVPPRPGPDLQPTAYCTAMWNGLRCGGEHVFYGRHEHHVAMTSDEDGIAIGQSWTDGCGGLDIREVPAPVYFDAEVQLEWSALNEIHCLGDVLAENFARDMKVPLDAEVFTGLVGDWRAWFGTFLIGTITAW